jgi:hypothetical protein
MEGTLGLGDLYSERVAVMKGVDSCIGERERERERFFIEIRQTDVVQKAFNV